MFIPSVLFRCREWLASLFLTRGFTLVFSGRALGNWWGKERKRRGETNLEGFEKEECDLTISKS